MDGKKVVNFFLYTRVVTKFELAKSFVEKNSRGQKLCNCVNSHKLEGYLRAGNGWKGFVKLF